MKPPSSSRAQRRLGAVFAALCIAGCTADSPTGSEGTGGSSTGAATDPAESGGLGGTGLATGGAVPQTTSGEAGSESDDDGYEDDDGADGCNFTCPDDPPPGGPPFNGLECGLIAQDCPPGEKCMPWASDGGIWNASRCTEVAAPPAQAGAPCTVEGNAFSGVDSCDVGLMCFNVDPRTNEGTCRPLCGALAEPTDCPSTHLCGIFAAAAVCLPPCDPLAPECSFGVGCYPAGLVGEAEDALPPFFACDQVGTEFGEPEGITCGTFHSTCAGQAVCLETAAVPGCRSEFCCADVCPLDEPDPCPEGTACTPYADPAPNDTVLNVGVCRAPR